MNKVHRKIEYSLMALKHMSAKGRSELTTAKEVADQFHAPFDAVARSLQIMAQRGILKSEQGVQGGYVISRDLAEVTMLDLIEMMEGPTRIAKCMSGEESCEIKGRCNIVSPLENLNSRLTDFYRSLSLREILQAPRSEVSA